MVILAIAGCQDTVELEHQVIVVQVVILVTVALQDTAVIVECLVTLGIQEFLDILEFQAIQAIVGLEHPVIQELQVIVE